MSGYSEASGMYSPTKHLRVEVKHRLDVAIVPPTIGDSDELGLHPEMAVSPQRHRIAEEPSGLGLRPPGAVKPAMNGLPTRTDGHDERGILGQIQQHPGLKVGGAVIK